MIAPMLIDHVAVAVEDAAATASRLRERFGLGSERGAYLELAGTRMHTVWLEPPQYLEFHTVENRETAAATPGGQAVLACLASSRQMLAWAVLVDDLEAVSARLGLPIFDYTLPHPDGTLRGWRSVSGPPHLPFFIDYPRNGDRVGRMRDAYLRMQHTSAPTRFAELLVGGSAAELSEWLGPNELPVCVVPGAAGIHEARIATARGVVAIA